MTATTVAPPVEQPTVAPPRCVCGNPERTGVPGWHTARCPALDPADTKQCATRGCTARMHRSSYDHCPYHDPDGSWEASVADRGEALQDAAR